MKITSIELTGFWAYRDHQSIAVGDHPLIVGVGENGTGKSAILVHAVLAAFYGRFPTATIAESITTGASQGHVSVEFLIGDTAYRVGRMYPRTGRATGRVLVADSSEKTGWRTITESGVTEVTAMIVELTGMDYNTASMTWVAEQGQYGKFSGADAGKRFQLLSGIVGLDVYTPLAKAAKVLVKTGEGELLVLDSRISELTKTLDAADAENDVSGFSTVTDGQLTERETAANTDVDRVGLALAELNSVDPRRQTVEARQALELVRNARVNTLESARANHARATRELGAATSRGAATRLAATTRARNATDNAVKRTADARANAALIRRSALDALALIAVAERELPELTDLVAGCSESANDARDTAAVASATMADEQTRRGVSVAEWATLKTAVADAEARIELLSKTASSTEHTSCFSCGQHLSAEDATALIASQRLVIEGINTQQATVKAAGTEAKEAIGVAERARDAALAAAKTQDALGSRASKDLAKAEALIATKTEREDAADDADIAVTRATNEEVTVAAAAAAEMEAAVDAATAEETLAVDTAASEIQTSADLVEASTEPTAEETTLARDLAAAEARISDGAQAVDERRQVLESERQSHRQSAQTVNAEITRRSRAAVCRATQMALLTTVNGERAASAVELSLNSALFAAYSPTGIPAMIIAGVVDELNDAVNVALNRLSRGTLTVQLRANKEKLNGSSENKVTVYVETPTGLRSYEGLSGGQKFRVDIAIRMGLTNAVARSTGVPIRSFILDEGWGSLDEKGILSAMETVSRLSEDTNVITVSHIEAVREAFPARVEVVMEGGNSVANVVA